MIIQSDTFIKLQYALHVNVFQPNQCDVVPARELGDQRIWASGWVVGLRLVDCSKWQEKESDGSAINKWVDGRLFQMTRKEIGSTVQSQVGRWVGGRHCKSITLLRYSMSIQKAKCGYFLYCTLPLKNPIEAQSLVGKNARAITSRWVACGYVQAVGRKGLCTWSLWNLWNVRCLFSGAILLLQKKNSCQLHGKAATSAIDN